MPIQGCTLKPASNISIAFYGLQEKCKNMVMRCQSPLVYINSNRSIHIPDIKRITVQLPVRSQEICQFCLYWCKGMSGTAALHIVYNQASKMR